MTNKDTAPQTDAPSELPPSVPTDASVPTQEEAQAIYDSWARHSKGGPDRAILLVNPRDYAAYKKLVGK